MNASAQLSKNIFLEEIDWRFSDTEPYEDGSTMLEFRLVYQGNLFSSGNKKPNILTNSESEDTSTDSLKDFGNSILRCAPFRQGTKVHWSKIVYRDG